LKRSTVIRFLKIYLVFWLFAVAVSVVIMEIIIGSLIVPERQEFASEHGMTAYTFEVFFGTTIFYTIFSFFGALIFYFKNYNYKKMGLLSLLLGFILEFTILQPNIPEGEGSGASWVQGWYSLNISGETIVGTLISAIYWFMSWAIPTYIIYKFLIKQTEILKR